MASKGFQASLITAELTQAIVNQKDDITLINYTVVKLAEDPLQEE